jgi:hypothetical protein
MSIPKLAAVLRGLTWAAALLVVVLPPLTRSGAGFVAAGGAPGNEPLAIAMLMPPYLVIAWGLIQLSGFCRQLARGAHFSESAARALLRFGWSLTLAACLLPVTRGIAMAVTYQPANAAEWGALLWRAPPLLASAIGLVMGLIMIVFAAILRQAKLLADENASFV